MTVKSSDVLRLAAELAIDSYKGVLIKALREKGEDFLTNNWVKRLHRYVRLTSPGYGERASNNEVSMALCLAAAIAESEGD